MTRRIGVFAEIHKGLSQILWRLVSDQLKVPILDNERPHLAFV